MGCDDCLPVFRCNVRLAYRLRLSETNVKSTNN